MVCEVCQVTERLAKLNKVAQLVRQYLDALPYTMSGWTAQVLRIPLTPQMAAANVRAAAVLTQLAAALKAVDG